MALHPDVTRKMRAEVLQHCGRHEAPTLESIKELRYGTSGSHRAGRPVLTRTCSTRRD